MSKHVVLRAGDGLCGPEAFFGPVMMDALSALEERRTELFDQSQAIIAAADGEERELTEEEVASIEANTAAIENLDRQISARQALKPVGQGRRAAPEPATAPAPNNSRQTRQTVPASPRQNDPRNGFKSMGEFAMAVHAATRNPGGIDARLQNAATTFGNEGAGADGGFAVPPEFRRSIWQKVMDDENLITRCDRLETSSNNMVVPKDETTPWQSTGGVLAYWEGEGDAATASKPQLKMDTMRLNKLMALVPVSEELLEDAPGLESWLRAKAPAKMRAKVNTAIVRGTGVGQPLGILNSGSLITVTQETSQAAASVLFANVNKMWNRLYGPCRRNAVWLINQDIEPQLDVMEFSPGSTVPIPVYLPPGGVSERPYATLKGRPVLPVEACSTLGTVGDIILVDLMQYAALTKAGQDIRTDVSMHLYFDQALEAFRFIFRVTGQPWWGSTIAPENGSVTRSWAVALETRAG
jgi:HK97 family phage major capsid protein